MMNDSEIDNTLTKLKSTSNTVVYESLVAIRKKLVQTHNGVKVIREKHALKDLVSFLNRPNEKILDVTLSILANCCLEHESRIEVASCGITGPLVAVLHNISHDGIQGRACRLVGNLAQTYSIALELHEKGVINGLVVVVDVGENSATTRQMAVRALRMLWSVQNQRSNMLELNAVHKVATLLSTPYKKKEDQDLLNAVIKALVVFSYGCSEQCAQQICVGGSGLKLLLSLLPNKRLKDSVLICISNLCYNVNARLILGIQDIVDVIVQELSGQDFYTIASTEIYTALASSLFLLCHESVNRAKIRLAGGLPIILNILRDCPLTTLKSRALHALMHFIYDERSLQELVKEGIVTVLVTRLGEFVKENYKIHDEIIPEPKTNQATNKTFCKPGCGTEENPKQKSKNDNLKTNAVISGNSSNDKQSTESTESNSGSKRFRASSPNYLAVLQERWLKERNNESNPTSPRQSGDCKHNSDASSLVWSWSSEYSLSATWSPGSQVSPYSPSSCRMWSSDHITSPSHELLSDASSPISLSSADGDFPEVYSPVCHDTQSDDEDLKECAIEEDHSDDSMDKCDSPSHSAEFLLSSRESQNPTVDVSHALNLLSRLSYMETPVDDLAVQTTLITLLDYISYLQNPLPRAARILRRIVRNHHYFLKIILHQFVLSIYSRLCDPLHRRCMHCNRLSDLGHSLLAWISVVTESGFGRGELLYHMLKADESIRRTLALTIPYIVNWSGAFLDIEVCWVWFSQKLPGDQTFIRKRAPELLKKLLIECKGLDILQQMIKNRKDEKDELLVHLPTSLSLLAKRLNINSPQWDASHEEGSCLTQYVLNKLAKDIAEKSEDRVILTLDDGCTIPAGKELLCSNSPVFEAMLQGNFKESKQQSIRLQAVSAISVAHLLCIMKLGRIPHCLPDLCLSSAMELLITFDKFLMAGCNELTNLIVRQFLSTTTVCDIYEHTYNMVSLSHCEHIRAKAIEYMLVAEMTSQERRNIFQEILEASYSQQVVNDTFDLLYQKLTTD